MKQKWPEVAAKRKEEEEDTHEIENLRKENEMLRKENYELRKKNCIG